MTDKATAAIDTVRRIRGALVVIAAVATVSGGYTTWLAVQRQVPEAVHEAALSLANWSWFGLIATACTLICLTQISRCAKAQQRNLEQHERQRNAETEAHITEAVDQAVNRFLLAQTSAGLRRDN